MATTNVKSFSSPLAPSVVTSIFPSALAKASQLTSYLQVWIRVITGSLDYSDYNWTTYIGILQNCKSDKLDLQKYLDYLETRAQYGRLAVEGRG
jgi:menaquinone-dependent protoporphyrinogen IX oxidase